MTFRTLSAAACVLYAVALLPGCNGKMLEMGPYPVTVDVAGGVFDPAQFPDAAKGTLVPVTTRMDYCSMPTEEDVRASLAAAAGDLAPVAEPSRAELSKITITAAEGDFRSVYAVTLRYIPADSGRAVILGTAFSIAGFGQEIVLEPPSDVDMLELIRANDASDSTDCPQLEITAFGSAPDNTVAWSAHAEMDVYVAVGF